MWHFDHRRENREMKSNQARVNMDTARDIQHDKSIKTKAEKDRRLKEKQSNNTKVEFFYPFRSNIHLCVGEAGIDYLLKRGH